MAGKQGIHIQRDFLVYLGDHRLCLGLDLGEGVAEGFLGRALGAFGPALDVVGRRLTIFVPRSDLIPVIMRFVAEHLFGDLYGVEQFRAGVEVAFLGLLGDLEFQAQRAQDGNAAVAEIGVVKDLAGLGFCRRAVLAGDFVDGLIIQRRRLLPRLRFIGVQRSRTSMSWILPLRSSSLRLLSTQQRCRCPCCDICSAGRQWPPTSRFDDPATDFAFTAARSSGEKRRAVEDDGHARAGLVAVARLPGLNSDHVEQKEQCAVVDARQLAVVATVGQAVDLLLLRLPVTPKGGLANR